MAGPSRASDPGRPGADPIPVTRTGVELRPDRSRVILKPFLPGDQVFPDGGLLDRILDLPEDEVVSTLADARSRFVDRHLDLDDILEKHFQFVVRQTDGVRGVSRDRRLLIGAYYSNEYSIEAAALTNPSVVPAPDQSGLDPGAQRFIMSLRGIGEGHISSIQFRSGVVDAGGEITVEPPSRYASTGTHTPPLFDKEVFCTRLMEIEALDRLALDVMDRLPDQFELEELEAAITGVEGKSETRRLPEATTRVVHWLATSNYLLTFAPESELSERVIFPGSSTESRGMEDARFVRFTHEDESVSYYATYTAYDGFRILPQLIETADFSTFRIETLSGGHARNKGAALFPRKIDGQYVALCRLDAESNYVMRSDNVRIWDDAEMIESPEFPWELARIGNSGSPLETEAGWLVITHGVGPFRTYSLGAILLDIDDPSRVIGHLAEPLLTPLESEREGYVPNVVYSCGSMIHGDELILPYGQSDTECRVVRVPLDPLLTRLAG
jgi:predicted GH43/DUF377 family glycosyl hydrolase